MQREWIELVVSTASQAALSGTFGMPSDADQQLEETTALSLPLLLPEDGYSCDSQQDGGTNSVMYCACTVTVHLGYFLAFTIDYDYILVNVNTL